MKHSASQMRELLDFEPETGLLLWKPRTRNKRFNTVHAGRQAGSPDTHGYLSVSIFGIRHLAHRLVWLLVYGYWPDGQIDHKNGVRTDNRLTNLRLVTNAVNQQNLRGPRSDNKVRLLGVSPHRNTGRYIAKISANGRQVYLGIFDTAELAYAAYLGAKRSLHQGCTL